MCLSQVKGQSKTQKVQKVKAKLDKQEVEIRQGMTVAALAQAMNKDFGETQRQSATAWSIAVKVKFCCVFRSCAGGAAEHHRGPGLVGA